MPAVADYQTVFRYIHIARTAPRLRGGENASASSVHRCHPRVLQSGHLVHRFGLFGSIHIYRRMVNLLPRADNHLARDDDNSPARMLGQCVRIAVKPHRTPPNSCFRHIRPKARRVPAAACLGNAKYRPHARTSPLWRPINTCQIAGQIFSPTSFQMPCVSQFSCQFLKESGSVLFFGKNRRSAVSARYCHAVIKSRVFCTPGYPRDFWFAAYRAPVSSATDMCCSKCPAKAVTINDGSSCGAG